GPRGTGHAGQVQIHQQRIGPAVRERNVQRMRYAAFGRAVESHGTSRRAQGLQEQLAQMKYVLAPDSFLLLRQFQCSGQTDGQGGCLGARTPSLLLMSSQQLRSQLGMPPDEEYAD